MKVAVYTCAVGNYDWLHGPRCNSSELEFLRFSDRRPWRLAGWNHRDLSVTPGVHTLRAKARFHKLRPDIVLPGYEIAVWIDSSVEVLGDVSCLLSDFEASGADIAIFAHPSGRTVSQEIDFADLLP